MNPLRLLKLYTRASRVMGLFTRASLDWDDRKAKGADMSKSLFKSKTFWINVMSAGLELSQILPLPAGTLTLVTNLLNIGLRTITNQPVHIIPTK